MNLDAEKQQYFEVFIERIVPDGYGIAFADNLTIFVPLVAPGDRVKIRVDRRKGKVAFASLIEVVEASPHRVTPLCPYFGPCGGCDFQQLSYPAQLQSKLDIIQDCLRRIGKLDFQKKIEIVSSPRDWNYRTRVQWKHDVRQGSFGYFERNSHRVLDVKECPILNDPLQKELDYWRKEIKNKLIEFKEIQVVSNEKDVSFKFDKNNFIAEENFYAANKELEEKAYRDALPENDNVKEINSFVNGFDYSFDANAFFQVNHSILPQFVNHATAHEGGKTALDLYSGVGLFALPLARQFEQIIGIEGNPASVKLAQKNAEKADLRNVCFEISAVGEWLIKNEQNLPTVDFVLLDPPRTGAERETIDSLLLIKPQRIVYVSCNPATLARDLRLLTENIYEIEKITAFDFFPQTHHVETVVHLRKNVD